MYLHDAGVDGWTNTVEVNVPNTTPAEFACVNDAALLWMAANVEPLVGSVEVAAGAALLVDALPGTAAALLGVFNATIVVVTDVGPGPQVN